MSVRGWFDQWLMRRHQAAKERRRLRHLKRLRERSVVLGPEPKCVVHNMREPNR